MSKNQFTASILAATAMSLALPAVAGTPSSWILPNSDTLTVDSTVVNTTTSTHLATETGSYVGSYPVTFNVTETRQGTLSTFSGTATQAGQSAPVSCSINTATGAVSGNSQCANYAAVMKGLSPVGQAIQAEQRALVQSAIANEINRTQSQRLVQTIQRRIAASVTPRSGTFKKASLDGEHQQTSEVTRGHDFTGVSAGDESMRAGVWATYTHNWISNDWESAKSNGGLNTGIFGGDYRITDNAVVGLTVSYQNANIRTAFNDGVLNSDGYTFVPYAAVGLLDGRLVLDAMTGFGFGGTDVKYNRSVGAVKGNYDSTRWLLSTNATYNHPVDKLTLSGKLGWLSAYEWANGYTDSNNTTIGKQTSSLGELSIGGRAAYALDPAIEPYIGVTYMYDAILGPNGFSRTRAINLTSPTGNASLDRNEIEGVVGINITPSDRITAGLEVSHGFLRQNEGNTAVAITARISF